MIDNWTPIRDSIVEKGRKYGDLDIPYVIAVNALEPADTIDIVQALYGQEEFIIDVSGLPQRLQNQY